MIEILKMYNKSCTTTLFCPNYNKKQLKSNQTQHYLGQINPNRVVLP